MITSAYATIRSRSVKLTVPAVHMSDWRHDKNIAAARGSLPETTSFALALHPFREEKERDSILTGSRHTASDFNDLEFTFAGAHSALSDA
jgi:hypothetical protein